MEYLIKRTDGDWFSLHKDNDKDVFLPDGATELEGSGDYGVELNEGGKLEINFEEPGYHIIFVDYNGDESSADKIVNEMLQKLTAVTGEHGEVIRIA